MKLLVRYALLIAGCLSLALGVLGIFLPLIPTTPLLLLAAACFVRSSERLYRCLLTHKWLGPPIRDYREGRGVSAKLKAYVLVVLWITVTTTALLLIRNYWVRLLLFFIAAAVTIYLLSLKPRDGEASHAREGSAGSPR